MRCSRRRGRCAQRRGERARRRRGLGIGGGRGTTGAGQARKRAADLLLGNRGMRDTGKTADDDERRRRTEGRGARQDILATSHFFLRNVHPRPIAMLSTTSARLPEILGLASTNSTIGISRFIGGGSLCGRRQTLTRVRRHPGVPPRARRARYRPMDARSGGSMGVSDLSRCGPSPDVEGGRLTPKGSAGLEFIEEVGCGDRI